MAPFTDGGLREIKLRSKGKSELSGRTDRPLHCSHLNHTKGGDYNTKERGVRITIIEHLAYHLYFKGQSRLIGLKECQNNFAINMLQQGSVEFLAKIDKLEELEGEIQESTSLWEKLFSKVR